VHPFGLWTCIKPGNPEPPLFSDKERLSHLSPMLKSSSVNLFDSQINLNLPMYGSMRSVSGDEEERVRLVKFSDEVVATDDLDIVV
jgi:hypothetical protein